jgi:hypothetical protein
MKNYRKTSATKLITRFDNELKALLINDLKNVKNQLLHSNHQVRLQVR